MQSTQSALCHVCHKNTLQCFPEFASLGRVTSDCKPWPSGGNIGICSSCSIVQKLINSTWRDEALKIYDNYHLYHQSTNGDEQPVFDQSNGNPSPRSKKILEFAIQAAHLSKTGRMMDIGCGNGAMLHALSNALPNWELNGFEPNLRQPDKVLSIPGVKKIFDGELSKVSDQFDLVSIIHALEHIENPIPFLQTVRDKVNPGASILIQVPYFPDNPFDLLIADHCTHFTVPTLLAVLESAGLEPIAIRTDVVDKEISLVARPCKNTVQVPVIDSAIFVQEYDLLKKCIDWIELVLNSAKEISNHGNFGLFGTSISANWLFGELKESIEFFIDEDESRVGKLYRECPVYHPSQAPRDSNIYLVLPRFLAEKINHRLDGQSGSYHLPPAFL